MGVAFFSQNSQLLTFSLPTKEIFSCSRPKSACGESSSCWFSFSATRNTITQVKDLTLGFSFRILFYFPKWQCLLEIRIFLLFFLAAIIRQNLDMRPWIDLTQLIMILNTCKKIIIILYAFLARISRREIVLNHCSLYDSFFP